MIAEHFCGRCGSKLSTKPLDRFNTQTGERLIGSVCRTCNPCDHVYTRLPWWHFFDTQCIKCGKKETYVY